MGNSSDHDLGDLRGTWLLVAVSVLDSSSETAWLTVLPVSNPLPLILILIVNFQEQKQFLVCVKIIWFVKNL